MTGILLFMLGNVSAILVTKRGAELTASDEATISPLRLDNRIRVARAELALSQEKLAALAGVTRQTISSIETGQYVPSALLAFVIAKHLGKRVDEVFTLSGDEP
jgi:putative transcriptional regulator